MKPSLPKAEDNENQRWVSRLVHQRGRLVAGFVALTIMTGLVALSACTNRLTLVGQSGATAVQSTVIQKQVDEKLHTCFFCHGPGGIITSPPFPVLAGQQKDYLSAQLKAFRDHTRMDPPDASVVMAPMAAGLDDSMIDHLAAYFSAQTPVPGSAYNPARIASGQMIYEQGVPGKALPCLACHGIAANGAYQTPRLADQKRTYLTQQIGYFAANTRVNGLMHQESVNLTSQQSSDVSAYLAAMSGPEPQPVAKSSQRIDAMVQVCSACHQFGGKDVPADFTFPRLAGQQKDYLVAQLKAFRDKSRADPRARAYMWDVAAGLDDATIERLAGYYAAMAPLPGSTQNPTEVAAGRNIFEQGVPSRIPPCMACHLANAQGLGTTPRLAGQRRLVLERQLGYFAANTRASGIMHQESKPLSRQEIADITAYLASQ